MAVSKAAAPPKAPAVFCVVTNDYTVGATQFSLGLGIRQIVVLPDDTGQRLDEQTEGGTNIRWLVRL